MNQIALPLDWPASESDADFIVTAASALAVRHLEAVGTWPVKATILTGPRKSGRSLLGRIFAGKTGARLIDDAEERPEAELFHAWNRAQEEHRPLLIIADVPPPLWQPNLPDLRSRLAATPVATLEPPDDLLIALLIDRQLAQRGLLVPPGLASYVAARIERTHIAVLRFCDLVDDAALASGRRVSQPLARDVLRRMGVIDLSPIPG